MFQNEQYPVCICKLEIFVLQVEFSTYRAKCAAIIHLANITIFSHVTVVPAFSNVQYVATVVMFAKQKMKAHALSIKRIGINAGHADCKNVKKLA